MMNYYNNSNMRGNNFIELKIYTENNELKKWLKQKGNETNIDFHKLQYPNAGFDLPLPSNYTFLANSTNRVDLEVKCAMFVHSYKGSGIHSQPISYYIYPRSSTGTKTKLRLANSVGIIDSGYRGNLMVAFDNISNADENIVQDTRLVQICSPTLEPFMITIVDKKNDLGTTERNEGGFGSTGM